MTLRVSNHFRYGGPRRVIVEGDDTYGSGVVHSRPRMGAWSIPEGVYRIDRVAPGKPAVLVPVDKTIENERWFPSDDRHKAILEALQAANERDEEVALKSTGTYAAKQTATVHGEPKSTVAKRAAMRMARRS